VRWTHVCGGGRGELGDDRGLEHEPGLHDVANIKALGGELQAHQRRHAAGWPGHDDGTGLRTRSGLRADEPEHLKHSQRLAHGGTAHAEFTGQRSLGGQVVSGGQTTGEQICLDMLQHEFPGATAVRRCGCGHVAHSSIAGCLWSGHVVRPQYTTGGVVVRTELAWMHER
jgi:hypothetical protein